MRAAYRTAPLDCQYCSRCEADVLPESLARSALRFMGVDSVGARAHDGPGSIFKLTAVASDHRRHKC